MRDPSALSDPPPALPVRGNAAQPIIAGILAALVGYASTFALVLAGLAAGGATPEQAGSGLFAATLGVAVLNFASAIQSRKPTAFAWSTPGVAFLLTIGAPPDGFPAVVGAFIMAGGLIVLAGFWRGLARLVSAIPNSLANAMLAGILLALCLAPLRAVSEMPLLALPIIAVWMAGLFFARRYAVPLAVAATIIILGLTTDLPAGAFDSAWPQLVPVWPVFTLDGFVRIALPLFVITMASQNLPGLAVMRANGYRVEAPPLFVATGLASAAAALFGGHTVNLAAITAAICAGPEAGPDPARRWLAPLSAGVAYLFLALGAGVAAAFIVASPPILIEAVAGLALMTSLAGALSGALNDEADRLPATVTFVTAASGIIVLGIGAAFWGIVAGLVLRFLIRRAK
jgi:benzoate membrane transport protein